MKRRARTGEIGELTFIVTEQHIIDFADDRMPAVLCTPWLIWFLEHAAREAMLPLLEEGESTVGVNVEVDHLAATPVGHKVTCTARVIKSDGQSVLFQLAAHDEHEQIARGMHKLAVIDCDRLRRRVEGKQNG